MKPLNIGLIGYGFMGRTHSNGYKRVNDFFPELQHRPVLKAVCGRSSDKVRAFAEQWQYESTETDWRTLVTSTRSISAPPTIHTPRSQWLRLRPGK